MTSTDATLPHYRALPRFPDDRPHARTRVGANPRNPVMRGNAVMPPCHVTILRHCRCQDCEHWIRPPYNECRHGIIRNGVKERPEFPADAWHYCALYQGPQISKDVFVWPRATSR